jgi:HK97 family phage prohead protease
MPEVGRKAEKGKEHTQSVVFEKKAEWSKASSKEWVKGHDYYVDGLDETDTQWRWRQYDPDDGEFDYRTKVIVENSITLILGIPKERMEGKALTPRAGQSPAPTDGLQEREVRSYPMQELRAEAEGGELPKIKGYAAVFDQLSEPIFGLFREKIKAGAFAQTAKEDDVRALNNHDVNCVLGRTKNGTLSLGEDEHGLKIVIMPPDTQCARDLITNIQRGDVDQMSFTFQVESKDEKWSMDKNNFPIRELGKVKLYDVSPVTFPAYPQTTVSVENRMNVFLSQEGEESQADQEVDRAIEDRKRKIQLAEKAI